jgi:hypothetical protein
LNPLARRPFMIFELVVVAATFAGGFGVGRIKNKAKLQAAQDLLTKEEAKATAEAKSLIAKVRSIL